jgi:hypothetical protein
MEPKPERIPIEVFEAIWGVIKDMPEHKIISAGVAANLALTNMPMSIKVMQLKPYEFAYIVFLLRPPGAEKVTIGEKVGLSKNELLRLAAEMHAAGVDTEAMAKSMDMPEPAVKNLLGVLEKEWEELKDEVSGK